MYYKPPRRLTNEEMTVNANYIYSFLLSKGWTKNAIAGILGNMQSESSINPNRWQSDNIGNLQGGYGLTQWTPATKYLNWADSLGYAWTDIDGQIDRLQYEVENGIQWIATTNYPMSFQEFIKSTDTPYNLALAFIANYERPLDPNQPIRGTQAQYWYEHLQGSSTSPTPKQRKLPIWFYGRIF
jgi:hypothetical protein